MMMNYFNVNDTFVEEPQPIPCLLTPSLFLSPPPSISSLIVFRSMSFSLLHVPLRNAAYCSIAVLFNMLSIICVFSTARAQCWYKPLAY